MSGTLFGRVAVVGLLVALVVGCGHAKPGGPGEAGPGLAGGVTETPKLETPSPETPSSKAPNSETPNPETPSSKAPSSKAPNPKAPNPKAPNPDDTQVTWVPPGPGSDFPPLIDEQEWYRAFRKHNCDAIAALGSERDQRQLYAGLGDACRAVQHNNDRLWASAESELQHVDDLTDCLDQLALRLLRDLVMAHQRAPHANIRIVDPPPGTTCGSHDPSRPQRSATSTTRSVTPIDASQIQGDSTRPHASVGVDRLS
jgi:hypothetical protein